jgi:hypothetical protein
LEQLSATQISLGNECLRKYALRYIAGIKQPESEAQALGKAVEDRLAAYLTEGTPVAPTDPAGKIAAPALVHLPPPKVPGLVLQQEFFISNDRFGFLGFKDCRLPSSHVLPPLAKLEPGTPAVVDFKTTKHFKYRKSKEKLRTDVQANLYAFDELVTYPELDYVDLYWLTMGTTDPDKPIADFAHYRAHKDDVAEQFAKIEATGEKLYQIRIGAPKDADETARLAYAMSVEPNPNQCKAFGGCPHQPLCNLHPKVHRVAAVERLRAKQQERSDCMVPSSGMSALERLKSRKPVEVVGAPPVEAAPEEVSTYEPPLGINPPEKDLPIDVAPPVLQPAAQQTDEAPKRRGRSPGSKNRKTSEEIVMANLEKTAERSAELIATIAPDLPVVEDTPPPSPEAVLACIRTLILFARTVK